MACKLFFWSISQVGIYHTFLIFGSTNFTELKIKLVKLSYNKYPFVVCVITRHLKNFLHADSRIPFFSKIPVCYTKWTFKIVQESLILCNKFFNQWVVRLWFGFDRIHFWKSLFGTLKHTFLDIKYH